MVAKLFVLALRIDTVYWVQNFFDKVRSEAEGLYTGNHAMLATTINALQIVT